MPSYSGKLLELLSINREIEKTSITVKLTLEQEILLNWEIDNDTAYFLEDLMATGTEHDKYRLSFHHIWDAQNKQFHSFLTKTFREDTEKLSFPCSEVFIHHLNEVKALTKLQDLQSLSFISVILPDEEKGKAQKEAKAHIHHLKINWFLATVITILTILLMGFSSHFYLNETAFAKKETIVHKSTHPVAKQTSQLKKVNVVVKKKVNTPQIPTFKINKAVAFSVPDGSVALTFDDGPSKYTKEIVDVLKKYHAGATFFFVGQNVEKYPDNVKYVHTNGLAIGNHSMNHPVFPDISYRRQVYELTETNKLIEQITSQPVVLFRPPYEAKDQSTIKLVTNNHMKMVLWDRDTEDWKTNNATDILHYVTHTKSSGTIILLHESQEVLDALPKIIEYLQSKHLQIVNLGV